MTITLWGRESSANVQKVRWALAELGLAYEHVPLGGKFGGNNTADYLAMNPNGLVPTLRDGELVLWESHAIVRYLAATYGAGTLWPESPPVRAKSDQWVDWTATTFQQAWIDVFWRAVRTPEPQRDLRTIAQRVAETERCLAILDGQLAKTEFLAGDRLTYGDIPAGVAMFPLDLDVDCAAAASQCGTLARGDPQQRISRDRRDRLFGTGGEVGLLRA